MLNMELSVISEEISNSATLEDEAFCGSVTGNFDAEFDAVEVDLQLTVESDRVNSSVIPPLSSENSVITSFNEYPRTTSSSVSVSEKISRGRTASQRVASDVAVAQAKVFRQYLLNGDIEARISELDNSFGLRSETSIWAILAKNMYGEIGSRLQQRMYVAWRRKRAGSVRDRVLSSLKSEGLLTVADNFRSLMNTSQPQSHRDSASVAESKADMPVNNCASEVNTEKKITSRCNISHETQNGSFACGNGKYVNNCTAEMHSHRLTVYQHQRQNQPGFIRRHIANHWHSRHHCHNGVVTSRLKRQQMRTKQFHSPVSALQKSSSSSSLSQLMSDDTSCLELDDVDIQKAMDILKVHCLSIAGLEHVGLGTCIRGCSVPRFAAAGNRQFVQIVNVGDHWVCATNLFGETTSDVYVYDSLFSRVTPSLVVQISSILRLDNTSNSITFHVREFKQQKPGTRWCGYYAVAAAFAVCQGVDPTGTVYTVELLHDAVKEHLEAGSVGLLPATNCKSKRDVQTLTKQRLFCICQKRAMGEMVRCERCFNRFHASCVAAFQLPLTADGQLERGPCCSHVTDGAQ